jgi:hypothetical protein
MTNHIFQEPKPGIVMHTPASKVLAEIPVMNEWVDMVPEEMWPVATSIVSALRRWPRSEEGNETVS